MDDDKKQLYDRRDVSLDDKERKIDLSRWRLVAPEVGICEPPLRIYPLNNEWAKIVIGLVSWLATIAPWQGAEDETFPAIQEIETFMLGCDPCEGLLACFQAINDTPYEDLSEVLKQLHDLLKALVKKEGSTTYPRIYNDNPVLLPPSEECDYDHLFAAATGLVDLANVTIIDLLQKIENTFNALEVVGEIISAIPGVGLLPIDECLALAEGLLDMPLSAYLSAYTETLKDQYRCDIFCIAQNECGFYFAQAFGYFANRASVSIDDMDFEDFVEFLAGGVFSGEEIIHVLHAFFFFCLAFNFSWLGVDADYLARVVQSKFNDSDPDWSILCDCSWSHTLNFLEDDYSPQVNMTQIEPEYPANWFEALGWVSGEDSVGARGGIVLDLDGDFIVKQVVMNCTIVTGSANTRGSHINLRGGDGESIHYEEIVPESGDWQVDTGVLDITATRFINLYNGSNNPGSVARCTSATISGIGSDPWPGLP